MDPENLKILFLEKLLGKGQFYSSQKELVCYCPFCFHHKKKLSINIQTDNYKCWVCGQAGKNLLYVLRKVGTKSDIENYIKNYKSKNVNIKFDDSQESFSISLPKEFIPVIECKNSVLGKRVCKYLTGRGLSENEILRNKIGVAFEGPYRDRVILPSFDKDGNLNFFSARALSEAYLKYLGPSVPKAYKTQIIFNELNIDWNKPVVIVEGFFDAVKAENAIPLFGSSLGRNHAVFQNIVKHKSKVVLALDSDAKQKSYFIASLFMRYDVDVYYLDVSPFGDVGEMSKEEFISKYESVQLMTNQNLFREKLKAIL